MTNDDILNSIMSLLAVDGKLNKHEMRFFDEVCERLDISDEQKNAEEVVHDYTVQPGRWVLRMVFILG